MHKYSSPLYLVFHILLHTLTQAIMDTYVTLESQVELVKAIVLCSSRYGKYQSISTPLSNHSKPFNQHVQGVKTWTLVGNYTAPTENYKQWFLTIHPDDMKKKHRPLSWYVFINHEKSHTTTQISSLQHNRYNQAMKKYKSMFTLHIS